MAHMGHCPGVIYTADASVGVCGRQRYGMDQGCRINCRSDCLTGFTDMGGALPDHDAPDRPFAARAGEAGAAEYVQLLLVTPVAPVGGDKIGFPVSQGSPVVLDADA